MLVTAVRDEGALRMWVCRLPVHIDPAGCTAFTEILGEFVTSQRADVGIGPYRTPANPYCLTTFERKADLQQPFKRNDLQIWCTVTGGAYHSAHKVSMCVRND